jgi:hypothetical protein
MLITRGRVFWLLGSMALLAYFIVPPAIELSTTACSLWSFQPEGCAPGVRGFFRGAVIYCLIAGILISRILDREPVAKPMTAALVAAIGVVLFALPLWLALHAAFW